MTLLLCYCAFTYGAMFSRLIDVLTDDETFEMFDSYAQYPIVFLPYLIAFVLFIFAPITFFLELLYDIYEIIAKVEA